MEKQRIVGTKSSLFKADIKGLLNQAEDLSRLWRIPLNYEGEPADCSYRTDAEIDTWKEKCPIKCFRNYLQENGILNEDKIAQIDKEVQAEVDEAVRFADKAPYPDPGKVLDSNCVPTSEEVSS